MGFKLERICFISTCALDYKMKAFNLYSVAYVPKILYIYEAYFCISENILFLSCFCD